MSTRVLITDPDDSLREEYERFLVARGFQVSTAANGQDCLRELREFVPHVLVLEPELPCGLGKRLIELIRNAQHVPTVPVVIATSREREQSMKVANFPVWAYQVKPVSMDQLAESIRAAAEEGP